MLALSRRPGESILIGQNIEVKVLPSSRQKGRPVIGVRAPRYIRVERAENLEQYGQPDFTIPGKLPQFFARLAWILPRPVRNRVFWPKFTEYVEDYLNNRGEAESWAERLWFYTAFTLQGFYLLIGSVGTVLSETPKAFHWGGWLLFGLTLLSRMLF